MAMFTKIYKTYRNHWKKSTFGLAVLSYAISSAKHKYETNNFMRACCEEALKYGEQTIPVTENPRSITVILNPAANKRSAKAQYEKYCEPLFHLAGLSVTVLQTSSEGHARELVMGLPESEPIVVAGGDGTLCEAITGLLRENENKHNRTIGVLPLGKRNMIGNKLFPKGDTLPEATQLTDAAMAVIKNNSLPKDVMKIEAIEMDKESSGKPIFAVGAIEWGAFRETAARKDKYWIYGPLREYATYIFNGYKSSLCWDCKATVKYSPPCNGCKNCKVAIVNEPKKFRWLDFIMPKEKVDETGKDFVNVVNESCTSVEERCFKTTEMCLTTEKGDGSIPSHLKMTLGKMNMGYFEVVSEGWSRVNGSQPTVNETITARSIEILPENVSKEGKEIMLGIDNEDFEIKPIKVTFMPSAVKLFCKENFM